MNVEITIRNISGTVDAIASKSDAHRTLIGAALGDKATRLNMNSSSEDIGATIECLKALGAEIDWDDKSIIVHPIKAQDCSKEKEVILDCGESGSTIRFLMPVVAALGIDAVFTGKGRLPERPQTYLLRALNDNGCVTSKDGEFPIKISGRLKSGIFTLPGDVSSQYITGLLFALPLLSGDSEIRITTPLQSRPYVDMTISTLKKFGIEVSETDDGFHVKGGQKYVSPVSEKGQHGFYIRGNTAYFPPGTDNSAGPDSSKGKGFLIKGDQRYYPPGSEFSAETDIEGDWSNAAFFVCCGALNGMKINGLNLSSVQGDKVCVDIVEEMGAKVTRDKDYVEISKGELKGTVIDASDCPDLVPVLASFACYVKGRTEIKGAKRLRLKESDRLAAVSELIRKAGGDVTERENGLIIEGGKELKKEFTVSSFNDHRLVMAAALLSYNSKVTITDAEVVNKSYPGFFEDVQRAGGSYKIVSGT